jgi:hypothetical protein
VTKEELQEIALVGVLSALMGLLHGGPAQVGVLSSTLFGRPAGLLMCGRFMAACWCGQRVWSSPPSQRQACEV